MIFEDTVPFQYAMAMYAGPKDLGYLKILSLKYLSGRLLAGNAYAGYSRP